MSHPLWPIYDLRIRTPRLELRLPDEDDIVALAEIARGGLHAPDEMPFAVPWTNLESPYFEWSFIRFHWRTRGMWEPEHWGLELAVLLDGRPVGAQGLYAGDFAHRRTVHSGSWLGPEFRRRGIGTEMRAAILALAFDGLGAEVAETEAFADNGGSIGVSRAVGYEENGIGRMAPMGEPRDTVRFRLTRGRWLRVRAERGLPEVEIEGLEPSLPLFGIG
jgi:RimJ/RimL family protein N-acetyltransferase